MQESQRFFSNLLEVLLYLMCFANMMISTGFFVWWIEWFQVVGSIEIHSVILFDI